MSEQTKEEISVSEEKKEEAIRKESLDTKESGSTKAHKLNVTPKQ